MNKAIIKQRYMRKFIITLILLTPQYLLHAQQVDYSIVSVPEESGTDFTQITSANDYVCMPIVKRTNNSINWLSNRILDISKDGQSIAYLSYRNNSTNIFIKDISKQGGSTQRTKRSNILDFSYSPNGEYICFSEKRGYENQIFQTSANNGYVCRQITSGNLDYSPVYTSNMNLLFFARQETRGTSIWSYNIENNFLSNYSNGMNPYPIPKEEAFLCTRANSTGKSEIWKINYKNGIEECIVSNPNRSFTSPILSPNGLWILFVGESILRGNGFTYRNTDLFVCKIDGTSMTQLTYHAADDLSPIWSKDGKSIYFISQRGSTDGIANIWKMEFNY